MHMMKKSALALAIGGLVSASAFAGDIDTPTTSTSFSTEALDIATNDVIEGGELAVTLLTEYSANDLLFFEGFAGTLDPASAPLTIEIPRQDTNNDTAANGKNLTLRRTNASDENQLVYEIATIGDEGGDTTLGVEVTIAGGTVKGAGGATLGPIELDADAVQANGGVTVTYRATSAGGASGTGFSVGPPGQVDTSVGYITVDDQFSLGVTTRFDGVIDVNEGRLEFTDGDDEDTAAFGVTEGTFDQFVTVDSVDYTVTGPFAFVDTVSAGEFSTTGCSTDANAGTADEFTLSSDSTSLSFSCDGTGPVTLTIDNVDNDTLDQGSFEVSAVVNYPETTPAATTALDSQNLGQFALNGAQFVLPYVPFSGEDIDQIFYVINRSDQVGDITVELFERGGGEIDLGVVTTAVANGTTQLAPFILGRVPADVKESGRVGMVITIAAPRTKVDFSAAYKVGDDRIAVPARKCAPNAPFQC